MLTRATGHLRPRAAAMVLPGGLVVGGAVALLQPFGIPPQGRASGVPWFVLNGLILGCGPFAALGTLYWAELRRRRARYGLVPDSPVFGGVATYAWSAGLLALVPVVLAARTSYGAYLLVAVAGTAVLTGVLEIQRRCRPVLPARLDAPHLVVQWEAVWIGGWLVAMCAWGGGQPWWDVTCWALGGTALLAYAASASSQASTGHVASALISLALVCAALALGAANSPTATASCGALAAVACAANERLRRLARARASGR